MVVREKVEKPKENLEKLREDIISKGGHVAIDIKEEHRKEWVTFCLRIKSQMLSQIDKALEERVGITKTGWILEAIHEKLKRVNE